MSCRPREEFVDNEQFGADIRMEFAKEFIDRISLSHSDHIEQDLILFNTQMFFENRPQTRDRSDFRRLPDSLCAQLFESFPWSVTLSLDSMSLGPPFDRNLFRHKRSLDWTDQLFNSLQTINSTTFFRKVGQSIRKLQCNSSQVAALVPALALMRQLDMLEIGPKDTLSVMVFIEFIQTFSNISSFSANNELLSSIQFENAYLDYFYLFQRLKTFRGLAKTDLFANSGGTLRNLSSLMFGICFEPDLTHLHAVCNDPDLYSNQIETLDLNLCLGTYLPEPWRLFDALNSLHCLNKLNLTIFNFQQFTNQQYDRLHQGFLQNTRLPPTIEVFSLTLMFGMSNSIFNENYLLQLMLATLPNLKRFYLNIDGPAIEPKKLELQGAVSTRIEFFALDLNEQPPINHQLTHCSFGPYVQCLMLRSLVSFRHLDLCLHFPNIKILFLMFCQPPALSIDSALYHLIRQLPRLQTIFMGGYRVAISLDSFQMTLSELVRLSLLNPGTCYQFRIPLSGQKSNGSLPVRQTLQQLEPLPNNLKIY